MATSRREGWSAWRKDYGNNSAAEGRGKGCGRLPGRRRTSLCFCKLEALKIHIPLTFLCRAPPGPSTMRHCLWKYIIVVVSLIFLSFFLQENNEEHLTYNLSLVRTRGWDWTVCQSFGRRGWVSSYPNSLVIIIEILRRGHLKNQESVREKINIEPALKDGEDLNKGKEEERAV